MTMFKIDDLIAKVRAIPPSSETVVEKFAGKCYLAANGDHLVTEEAVITIVDNWPNGCQGGRDAFLQSLDIKREIVLITISMVEIFQFRSGAGWYPCNPDDKDLKKLQNALIGTYRWKTVSANPDRDDKRVSRAENVTFDAVRLKALTQGQSASLHLITGGWMAVDTTIVGAKGQLSMRFFVGETHKAKV